MKSPVTTSAVLPVRPQGPRSVLDEAPLPARRAASPVFEWDPLPAENPTFRPWAEPPRLFGARFAGDAVGGAGLGAGIKGYAPVSFTLGVRSQMLAARARAQAELVQLARRPVRPRQLLPAAPLSCYYTTPFYSTPDVALAGLPAASTRTVEENLPHGVTQRRAPAAVHPFRVTMVSNYPFRTPPRICRAKDDVCGPCIMMHM